MECVYEYPETSVGRADGGQKCNHPFTAECAACGLDLCEKHLFEHQCTEPETMQELVERVMGR